MSNVKNVDLFKQFVEESTNPKDYAEAISAYIEKKTSIAREIRDIIVNIYRFGGLYRDGTINTINEDVLPKSLWYTPIPVIPDYYSNSMIQFGGNTVYISMIELCRAINDHGIEKDDDFVTISYFGMDYRSTMKELVCDISPEARNILNGIESGTVTVYLPFPVLQQGMIDPINEVLVSNGTELDYVVYRDATSMTPIKIKVIDTIAAISSSVDQSLFDSVCLHSLGSQATIAVSDIKTKLDSVLGRDSISLLNQNQGTLNIITANDSNNESKIQTIIGSIFASDDGDLFAEDNVDSLQVDNVSSGQTFSMANYTGTSASSMWTSATLSTGLSTALSICAQTVKATSKIILSGLRFLGSTGSKLWRRYITPAYISKDFVKSEFDTRETHVDIPFMSYQISEFDRTQLAKNVVDEITQQEDTTHNYAGTVLCQNVSNGGFKLSGLENKFSIKSSVVQPVSMIPERGHTIPIEIDVQRTFKTPSGDYITWEDASVSTNLDDVKSYELEIFDKGKSIVKRSKMSATHQDSININESYTYYDTAASSVKQTLKYEDCFVVVNFMCAEVEVGGVRGTLIACETLRDGSYNFSQSCNIRKWFFPNKFSVGNKFQEPVGQGILDNAYDGGFSTGTIEFNGTQVSALKLWTKYGANSFKDYYALDMITSFSDGTRTTMRVDSDDGICDLFMFTAPRMSLTDGTLVNPTSISVSSVESHIPYFYAVVNSYIQYHPGDLIAHFAFNIQMGGAWTLSTTTDYPDCDFSITNDMGEDSIKLGFIMYNRGVHIKYASDKPSVGSGVAIESPWDYGNLRAYSIPWYSCQYSSELTHINDSTAQAVLSLPVLDLDYSLSATLYSNWENVEKVVSDTAYYDEENVHVRSQWSQDENRLTLKTPPMSYIDSERLDQLTKDVVTPIDIGCAAVVRYAFASFECIHGADDSILFNIYLSPVNHKAFFNDDGSLKYSYDTDTNCVVYDDKFWSLSDKDELSKLIKHLGEGMRSQSNDYSYEQGDLIAYQDLCTAKFLTDLYLFMLTHPHSEFAEFFKAGKHLPITGMMQYITEGEINNAQFATMIYSNDAMSEDTKNSVVYSWLTHIVANKLSFMQVYFMLYGRHADFFPYMIGDRLQAAKWHISTDTEIQNYVDKLASALIIAAMVIAAAVVFKVASVKLKKFFKKKAIARAEVERSTREQSFINHNKYTEAINKRNQIKDKLQEVDKDSYEYVSLKQQLDDANAVVKSCKSTMKSGWTEILKQEKVTKRWAKLATLCGMSLDFDALKSDAFNFSDNEKSPKAYYADGDNMSIELDYDEINDIILDHHDNLRMDLNNMFADYSDVIEDKTRDIVNVTTSEQTQVIEEKLKTLSENVDTIGDRLNIAIIIESVRSILEVCNALSQSVKQVYNKLDDLSNIKAPNIDFGL